MDNIERDRLKQSIQYAEECLAKGLFLPEDAAQLRRMIAYYQEKIKEDTNANIRNKADH